MQTPFDFTVLIFLSCGSDLKCGHTCNGCRSVLHRMQLGDVSEASAANEAIGLFEGFGLLLEGSDSDTWARRLMKSNSSL